MDRQDRRNRQIKFLDDGGDCNDRDDHMETGLKAWFPYDRHDRRDRRKWFRRSSRSYGNTNFLFSDDRDDQDCNNRGDRK